MASAWGSSWAAAWAAAWGATSAPTLTLTGISDADGFGAPTLSPGGVTLQTTGIANVDSFGSPTLSPGAVSLQPTGFANTQAFGAPSLSLELSLTGFASTNAFGAPTLTAEAATLTLTWLSDADAFGSPALVPGPVQLTLTGVTEADRFGVPVLQPKKKNGQGGGGTPGGVGAGQKYATRIVMDEGGLIVSLEVVSSVTKTVNTRMALYADVAGSPGALLSQSAVKASVVTGENVYPLLTPISVLDGTALWAALHSDGNFNWFLSAGPTSRFNADAFADGPSNPFGASTLSANKAPVFVVFLEAVTLQLTATGVEGANAFGSPTLVPEVAQSVSLTGFADADGFGSPELRPASATMTLTGFADADGLGSITLLQAARLTLTGFSDADAFGTPALERASVGPSRPAMVLTSRMPRVRTLRNRNARERDLSNPIGGMRRLLKRTRHRQPEGV